MAAATGYRCHAVENLDPAVRKIVDHGHLVAGEDQCDTGVRADIAAAAGDQDIHSLTL
jgi:hypothetical protein